MAKSNKKTKKQDCVFIRTVTHYYTGELVRMDRQWMVLKQAAWIADTGRFAEFLSRGDASEVEPYPDNAEVHIGIGAVVDWIHWPHPLPRVQK
jgi:hypothetical protein